MSGSINDLLRQYTRDNVVGPTQPRFTVPPQNLPRTIDPETYTGLIPTPSEDFGPTALSMPHDYTTMQQLLRPGDPAAWNQLLRLIYYNRENRRT